MAILTNAFQINGVIDTSKNVLANINDLATAAGAWMTYDITTGLWSVIINRSGSSVFSFNNSNIIGAVNVSGTGINEAYNKVTVQFPHKDLRDQTDYVDLVIPVGDRYPNEIDNTLQIDTNLFNDPVQAAYIGQVELKQSRVDRVIEFRTDYTALGLRAGDIIDVTNDAYGFVNKMFRVTRISETDGDDGGIELSIQALEYDEAVYDSTGLVREERSKKTGIVPKAANSALTTSDQSASMDTLTNAMANPALAGVLGLLIGSLVNNGKFRSTSFEYTTPSTVDMSITPYSTTDVGMATLNYPTDYYVMPYLFTAPQTGIYKIDYFVRHLAVVNESGGYYTSGGNNRKNTAIKISTNGGSTWNSPGNLAQQISSYDTLTSITVLTGTFTATKDQDFTLAVATKTDWGPTHPQAGGYSGARSLFLANIQISLLQAS